jgi:hypothetical protein
MAGSWPGFFGLRRANTLLVWAFARPLSLIACGLITGSLQVRIQTFKHFLRGLLDDAQHRVFYLSQPVWLELMADEVRPTDLGAQR